MKFVFKFLNDIHFLREYARFVKAHCSNCSYLILRRKKIKDGPVLLHPFDLWSPCKASFHYPYYPSPDYDCNNVVFTSWRISIVETESPSLALFLIFTFFHHVIILTKTPQT
jgi:hypothetical protein